MLLGALAVASSLACRAAAPSRPTDTEVSPTEVGAVEDGDVDRTGASRSVAPDEVGSTGPEAGSERPSPDPELVPREITLAGYSMALRERDGRCIVEFLGAHAGTLVLRPRPPCFFVHDSKGALQHRGYPDVGVDEVAAVVGSMADAEDRARWNVSEALACGMQTQGVLVRSSGVTASPNQLDRMLVCPTMGVDEIVLFELAHP